MSKEEGTLYSIFSRVVARFSAASRELPQLALGGLGRSQESPAEGDMIKIRIENEERLLAEADEQWINQQINQRRAAGQPVCVRVIIKEGDVDMVLSTPTCGASGPGGRAARPRESSVFDLWDRRGLNETAFTGGNLVAFLKQIRDIV